MLHHLELCAGNAQHLWIWYLFCILIDELLEDKALIVAVLFDQGHVDATQYFKASQAVSQNLDLTPRAIIPDLYLPSVSLPSVIFHLIVLFAGPCLTWRKITLFKFVIFKCKCSSKWHFNGFGIVGDLWLSSVLFGSIYHQLVLLCLEWSYGSDLGSLCLSEPFQRAQNRTSPVCRSTRVWDCSFSSPRPDICVIIRAHISILIYCSSVQGVFHL